MKVFDLVNFLINNPCEDPEILKVILFIKKILEVAFIIVPIVLIVLITFDFIKSVTAGNEDTMKKNQKIVIKRLIYSVMLFFVIPIVNLVFSAFGTSENFELISDEFQGKKVSYLSCWDNAKNLETINKFEIVATFTSDGGKIFGGDEKDGKIQKSCGGSISCEITVPNATKKGYRFKGWQKEGYTKIYQVGQKALINRDDNFVAMWEMKPVKDPIIVKDDKNKEDTENKNSNNKQETEKENGDKYNPTAPIALSNDIETRIKQMLTYAKGLEGFYLSEFNEEVGGSYGGDWCSWFVYKLYEKFNFSFDIDFNSDEISYACGWLELEDGAYNGYFRGVETGDLNYTPQPGDLIIFTDDTWCATHVGMVTAVDSKYIYTVEGNTAGYGDNWAYNSQVNLYQYDFPNEGGKYIGDGNSGIAGYYSLRKLISMNQ